MSDPLPVYNPDEPAHPQENDWSCSQDSAEWALWAYGRTPDDDWMEASMQAAGVIDPAVGLCDASGAGLARWLNAEYGTPEYGYLASNDDPVSFDDVAYEAAEGKHPLMIGGRAWGHWSGCSGYDAGRDVLILKNPAEGYQGVWDTMSRGQFAALGSFSMVRLTHPAAEGLVPAEPDPPAEAIDYTPWTGFVGSGLLTAMQTDGVVPAQSQSTWLPLGSPAAEIEECAALDGTIYRWHLPTGSLWKYPSSS
jgi:hypothetical protein